MKIYTKRGDEGTATTVLGEKLWKGDIIIELNGGIDEINANIGYLRSVVLKIKDKEQLSYINSILMEIQYTLFKLGGDVSSKFTDKYVSEGDVKFLEKEIDAMTEKLQPLKSFIYYSGVEAAAYSYVVGTVTRRVERVFARALEGKEYPEDYHYINRLSDFFHTLARYINHVEGEEDEIMKLRE